MIDFLTSTAKPEHFEQIEIKHQEEIIEQVGSPLVPVKSFRLLKRDTKNFTQEAPRAKEVDALLARLLERSGIKWERPTQKEEKKKSAKVTPDATALDQERLRQKQKMDIDLQLLAIKYKLNLN